MQQMRVGLIQLNSEHQMLQTISKKAQLILITTKQLFNNSIHFLENKTVCTEVKGESRFRQLYLNQTGLKLKK